MIMTLMRKKSLKGLLEKRVSKKKQLTRKLLEYVKQPTAPEVQKAVQTDTTEEDLEAWLDCDAQAQTSQTLMDQEIIDMVNP